MRRLSAIARNIEQKLVSEAIQNEPSELRRSRIMLVILGGSAVSCFTLLYFSYISSVNDRWIDIVLMLGHLVVCSSIFLIKFSDTMKWPTRAVALLGAIQLVVATAVSGGTSSPALYSLPVLPIFLAVLVDIRTNLIACSIVLLGIGSIFFVDAMVVPFPAVVNTARDVFFGLFWSMCMAIGISIYAQRQSNSLLNVYEKELEQRKVAQVELARVNESKDRFLAYMSHEMRNSLTAIVGASELLSMQKMQAEHPRYLESLKTAANSLTEIVETVLDFSQLYSGRMVFELKPLDIHPFLADVTSQFSAIAEGSEVNIQCEISADAPRLVIANKMRLRQVLANLLSNAIKFSNPGGEIYLSVSLDSEEGNGALFVVEDSGIGILEEDQTKIFVPYQRSNEELSRKGTGLGLPIAQGLLEKMGTTIKMESELNKGSRFYFVLPSAIGLPVEIPITSESKQPVLHGVSVLVAEDNAQAAVVVLAMLRAMGCKVWHARNGKEAISLFKEFNPDCVMMDIQMPIVNGVDAFKEIRKFEHSNGRKETSIFAVSGELHQEGLTGVGGFSGLLQKPFLPAELLKLISTAV